jgi:hypothetical protein
MRLTDGWTAAQTAHLEKIMRKTVKHKRPVPSTIVRMAARAGEAARQRGRYAPATVLVFRIRARFKREVRENPPPRGCIPVSVRDYLVGGGSKIRFGWYYLLNDVRFSIESGPKVLDWEVMATCVGPGDVRYEVVRVFGFKPDKGGAGRPRGR